MSRCVCVASICWLVSQPSLPAKADTQLPDLSAVIDLSEKLHKLHQNDEQ